MKRTLLVPAILIIITNISCKRSVENPFWGNGEQLFELHKVFEGERFPNVVVAMDGSVIATWGNKTLIRCGEVKMVVLHGAR
jgi:sialidase-1